MVISLVGMRFHVCVGILPHERTHAQPLEIDVSVTRSDSAPGVLDYRLVYSFVAERIERGPLEYLEDIASAIAETCVALDGATAARVAVRKPHVALGGPLSYAEVVAERVRA